MLVLYVSVVLNYREALENLIYLKLSTVITTDNYHQLVNNEVESV